MQHKSIGVDPGFERRETGAKTEDLVRDILRETQWPVKLGVDWIIEMIETQGRTAP
ncbi:MAG: hypothetical protein AAGF79_19935 [Pseudomonadota bacterium]